MTISSILKKLESKTDLNENDLKTLFTTFKEKKINDDEIKKLAICWRDKGERSEEIKILANLLFEIQPQINLTQPSIIDVCGTGGDKSNTFNVSTLTAVVLSSLGINVIKHSGRSTTSILGSVDVLSHFGVDIDLDGKVKEKCFKKTGLMFVSSNVLRDTFGKVKVICKEISQPCFVNLLGPLTNPYKTSQHLLGVSSIEWGELIASYFLSEKNKNAIVVCSKVNDNVFLDEFSFCGVNYVWHIKENKVKKYEILPKVFSKEPVDLEDLVVHDIGESKKIFEEVLRGKINGKRIKYSRLDIVALNVGAVLFLLDMLKSIREAYNHALLHIQSGKAWEHFQKFINCIRINKV